MIKFAAPLTAIVATLVLASPARAAQITATTSAKIIKPVSLTKLQDMDFGTLLVTNYAGTRNVVMSRAGGLTCPQRSPARAPQKRRGSTFKAPTTWSC